MKSQPVSMLSRYVSYGFVLVSLVTLLFGCSGDDGTNGTSFGTVNGTVTDTAGNKLAGITVTPAPAVNGVPNVTTDANGLYTMTIPNGNFTLTYAKQGYATATQPVTVVATQTTTKNVTMVQTAAAVVNVANAKFVNGTATLSATALVNDPSLQGQPATFEWKDASGAVIGTGPTITVSQPSPAAYKQTVANLSQSRVSVYPPGFDPDADANGFDVAKLETLNRFQVLAIPQKSFEDAAVTGYTVTATISTQNFSSAPTVSTPTNTLPFVPNTGIRNVPIGQPVVLQGKDQTTYNWTIVAPVGSNVTALLDPATRFPSFIPDAPGSYTITENGSGTTRTMTIYAGTYVGILNPAANNDPLGVVDPACSNAGCHPAATFFNTPYNGGVQFFDTKAINSVFTDWQQSGHREIMVQAMTADPSHYSLGSCAKCHSVGYAQYSSAIKSGGFKDVASATNFTDAAFRANNPTFFKGFDQVLRVSEVQCETCHGPNGSGGAHAQGTADTVGSRMSVASDMCCTCHGEPLRHGRFQEWRESGHGDFRTAMLEGVASGGSGVNNNCGGCHSGQGFPLWIQQLQAGNPSRTLNAANVAALSFLNADNVQPQTCSTCHIVHNPGKQSGLVGSIVNLRGDYQAGGAFDGITPLLPSGFQANGVGRGALCITCHNSRNGGSGTTALLHEDGGAAEGNFPTLTAYSGPHEACQGDVLMGRNGYFFGGPEDAHNTLIPLPSQLGIRSRHSILADACVTCHVEKTPTDPAFGYPPGVSGAGTNHTFNIVTDKTRPAEDQVNALCAQCHTFQGTQIQQSFDTQYNLMLNRIALAVLRVKFGSAAAIPANTTLVFLPGRTPQVSLVTNNVAAPVVNLATFLANAPGTPATGPIPASGFQLDLAKANWNAALVAPKYDATFGGSSYDNGTPVLNTSGGTVGIAGDQSKSVHNPTFVNNIITATTLRVNQL